MAIKIYLELKAADAKRAVKRRDLIIVIDVLRSCSSILNALVNGAKFIIPFKTLKEAVSMKKKYFSYILAGERKGCKPNIFDLGNSPSEFTSDKIKNKRILMTTTSGTRALINSKKTNMIYIGALLNAKQVAKKSEKKAREYNRNISLICAGNKGKFSFEDFICAGAIAREFSSDVIFQDITLAAFLGCQQIGKNLYQEIIKTEHAKKLIEKGFLEDIKFCCQLNKFAMAPIYREGKITI